MKNVVIIPALNEEDSIGHVLDAIPRELNAQVYVGDNGSTDRTAEIARSKGAIVVPAPRRGYGSACLAALKPALETKPETVLFLDADFSDYPEDLLDLTNALEENNWELVIGSRTSGRADPSALLPQARFGNWLATSLMSLRFGTKFTDLGPMRAIRYSAFQKLHMCDPDFGWTMEMQVKALRENLRVGEVPVRYRRRDGASKITGTVKGTVMAGYKILWTLFKYGWLKAPITSQPDKENK